MQYLCRRLADLFLNSHKKPSKVCAGRNIRLGGLKAVNEHHPMLGRSDGDALLLNHKN